MAQADGPRVQRFGQCQLLGSIVKNEFWFAAAVTNNLDISPVKVADSSSQGFGDRFLHRKPAGQAGRPALAKLDFLRRKEAPVETIAVSRCGALDPRHFYQVDPAD
jgi:hypothetical protein